MRCLILGGAGFIGSHIADALVDRGCAVTVFDRPNISKNNLRRCIESIRFVEGDFNNEKDLMKALRNVDTVIHLISTTLPAPSNDNPAYDVESNVIGSLKLLNLMVRQNVKRIIFASSGGTVYGIPEKIPIPESHPTNPICSYGISKLTIEKYLHLYHYLHGLEYAVFRMGNPYGERQRIESVQGAVTVFLGKALQDRPIHIWGDGKVARDYFYIADLVAAFVRLIDRHTGTGVYNIAGGKAYSLLDLIETIKKVTGKNLRVHFEKSRKLDVPVNCLDISRAQNQLGWQPVVPIEEGMHRTWQWLQGL
jgi:UDP-glucose 4-epimerase